MRVVLAYSDAEWTDLMKGKHKRIDHGFRRIRKFIYQHAPANRVQSKQLVFIFGCQRSGTTMLSNLFRNDLSSRVYTEKGLSSDGSRRILPLHQLDQMFSRDSASLIVGKPIVESQRAIDLLEFFPKARAIWMFRNFADVARSARKRFSEDSAFRNLKTIIDSSVPQTFAAENVSDETREVVLRHFSDQMSTNDANALYWYVRNVLYFEQQLHRSDRVKLCCYELFVADPENSLAELYAFLGRRYPGSHLVKDVHSRSVQSMPLKDLSDQVAELCNDLASRLENTAGQLPT